MDHRGLAVVVLLLLEFCCVRSANMVLPVERKFKGPVTSLSEIKTHDASRHRGRFLSTIDINLGGNGLPSETGLYYTKIGLGTPAKDFYVQVDTGSDNLWVDCADCTTCPKKSGLGMDLNLFDPKGSSTAKVVGCDDEFCTSLFDGRLSCKHGNSCPYSIAYGDGSTSTGFFVKDALTYNQVDGDLQTKPANSSVIFGCGSKQSGLNGSGQNNDAALSGIMGFGQSNTSAISQLAAAGKVKKVFSHCLDTIEGGGIYAIGEVAGVKYNTTSLIPGMPHYNVLLKDMEVDGELIDLPIDIFDPSNVRGTIIDSGTTLAYLPASVYEQVYPKIVGRQPGMKLYIIEEQFTCFRYSGDVDAGFPVVKFHFEGLSLTVYPHDYLFRFKEDMRCIGWMKATQTNKNGKDMMLLGDIVLTNKLVVYDVENMNIGWTDYNCSSSIKVKDDTTGNIYKVGAHKITSASSVLIIGRILNLFLFLVAILKFF